MTDTCRGCDGSGYVKVPVERDLGPLVVQGIGTVECPACNEPQNKCPLKDAKPCPFCGGTNLATPPGQAVVVCGDCDAAGPFGAPHPRHASLTLRAAVSKWNARSED